MNTCDTCNNYQPPYKYEAPGYEYDGSCKLMEYEHSIDIDRAIPWDAEGYSAGVHVGPKFGCIHWIKKESDK